MNHYLTILFLASTITFTASAQKLDSLKNWRIHILMNNEAFDISEDSLPKIPSRLLPPSFRQELEQLKILNVDGPAYVQTVYLLSFEDSTGKMIKVLSCGVGNFLFVDRFQKYWKIPQENRDSWLEILSTAYRDFSKN